MKENDPCIYCGQTPLTETHVFPRLMGGKTRPYLACKRCNGIFGKFVDQQLERNILRAYAVTNLGKFSQHDAFKKACLRVKGFDPNILWEFDKDSTDELLPKTAINKNLEGTLGAENAREILPKIFREKISDAEMRQLVSFLESPSDGSVTVGDHSVSSVRSNQLGKGLEVSGLTRGLDPRLLVKIAYENAAIWDLHLNRTLQWAKDEFLTEESIRSHNVDPRLNILSRVLGNIYSVDDFSRLKYHPYFYVYMGLTRKGTVYSTIGFYGAAHYLIVLGKCFEKNHPYGPISGVVTLYSTDDSHLRFQYKPRLFGGFLAEHIEEHADGFWVGCTQSCGGADL